MIFIMIIIYCHSCHISALERLILHLGILGVNLVELDVVAGEEGEEDVLHLVVVLLVDVLVAEEEHEAIKHNQPLQQWFTKQPTIHQSINNPQPIQPQHGGTSHDSQLSPLLAWVLVKGQHRTVL